jgi:putative two-component system response regulator
MARLLIVDDQADLAGLLRHALAARGYACDIATGVGDARKQLDASPYDLVMCDLRLGDGDGLMLAREIRARFPSIAILVVSAVDDPQVAEAALDLGAYGYLIKPVETTSLAIAISSALRRREAERIVAEQQEELEALVRRRSDALFQTIQDHQHQSRRWVASFDELLRLVSNAATPSPGAGVGHAERMARSTRIVAEAIGLPDKEVAQLATASVLHDIGNLALPPTVLRHPGAIGPAERRWIEQHPVFGHQLLEHATIHELRLGAQLALTHHERLDGSGYPNALTANEIAVETRIVSAVAAFDAMTSARLWRPAHGAAVALDTLASDAGIGFDPEVVRAMQLSLPALEALRVRFPDRAHPQPAAVALPGVD